VKSPWPGADRVFTYVLYGRGKPKPKGVKADGFFETPLRKVVTFSTTYIPQIAALGESDSIVGIDNAAYVSAPEIRARVAAGKAVETTRNGAPNIELLISLAPDAVFTYGLGNEWDSHPKLAEAGVPVVISGEWNETDPLARAEWIKFISKHRDRLVVGLSMGTLDDAWARRFEPGVSPPSARLRALHRLQAAGIPTFGMLCPVFPEVLQGRDLENLVEAINPGVVETVWAEPFNDRDNWERVSDRYPSGSQQREELARLFGKKKGNAAWSRYATELYVRLHRHAVSHRWRKKLAYLLYEGRIVPEDAGAYRGLDGVLLQGKPADNGLSRNESISALQRQSAGGFGNPLRVPI